MALDPDNPQRTMGNEIGGDEVEQNWWKLKTDRKSPRSPLTANCPTFAITVSLPAGAPPALIYLHIQILRIKFSEFHMDISLEFQMIDQNIHIFL